MTLRTALVVDGNSEGGQQALREFEQGLARAEGSAARLGQEGVKASVGLERLRQAQDAAAQAGVTLSQEQQRAAIAGRLNTQELARTVTEMQRVTTSAGAQRAGLQQLSYQIGDVATMWSMGARPMQIFASQGTQVVQAMSLMTAGSKGLLGVLGGPWGVIMISAATVVGSLTSSLWSAKEATRDVEFASYALKDAQGILGSVMELTTGKINTQSSALMTLAKAQAYAGQIQAQARLAEARAQVQDLTGKEFRFGGGLGGGLSIGRRDKNTKSAAELFLGGEIDAGTAIDVLRGMQRDGKLAEEAFLGAAAAISAMGVEAANVKVFEELEKALNGDTEAIQQFLRVNESRAKGLSETEKLLKKQMEASQSFIQGLEEEIAKIGLDAAGLRQLEVARALDAAATDAQRAKIAELSEEREKAIAIQEQLARIKDAKKGTESLNEEIAALQREASVIGEVGRERERRLFTLEAEAEIRSLLIKIADAELKGENALAEEYRKQIANIRTILDLKLKGSTAADQMDREAEAAARLNDHYRDMVDLLDRIGGAGSVLGSLLAIATGDYNGIASGPLGDVLAFALNQDTGRTDDKGAAILLGDELRKIFGSSGLFGQTLAQTLSSAGLGYAASNAILGPQSAGGQIGSAIGGIAGSVAGEAFKAGATKLATAAFGKTIGSALGSAVPVIGTILGGIAGSLLGGLFSGSKKGVVSIGGSGEDLSVSGTKHSNSERVAQATQAANSIIDSVTELAAAFNGKIDAAKASVTIGIKNDSYRVDTTGQGRTDLKPGVLDFGQDQAAAIQAVMKDLIEDGVISGIRASTLNILRSGDDLQAALQKALAFESVFQELEAAASPFAAELRALQASFEQMTTVFREAGATVEEYAQLQDLLAIKQQQLIDQASASYRATFYTAEENAAFAKQTISSTLTPLGYGDVNTVAKYKALVEATDALANPELYGTLMDLSDEFAVLKEAADQAAQASAAEAAAKKAAAAVIASQRGQLEVELLRAQGKDAEALAKSRELELAAMDKSLRSLQQQVYAAQDEATARDRLREAYGRQKAELEGTIDAARRSATSLRDFRDSLFETSTSAGSVQSRLIRLMDIGGNAAGGDLEASGKLPTAGREYIGAVTESATSLEQVKRAIALVANYTDGAIAAADGQADAAQAQLDAMTQQVGQLIDLNENVLSVHDAILQLQQLLAGDAVTGAGNDEGAGGSGGNNIRDRIERDREREERRRERDEERERRREQREERMLDRLDRLTADNVAMQRFWKGLSPDGRSLRLAEEEA